jgi:RNase P subunit RPR2
MKKEFSKSEVRDKINNFFSKPSFEKEEVKKIKRLAMKYKIPLTEKKKFFCKSCLSQLKGKIRVSKTHKTIVCESCNYRNKFRI